MDGDLMMCWHGFGFRSAWQRWLRFKPVGFYCRAQFWIVCLAWVSLLLGPIWTWGQQAEYAQWQAGRLRRAERQNQPQKQLEWLIPPPPAEADQTARLAAQIDDYPVVPLVFLENDTQNQSTAPLHCLFFQAATDPRLLDSERQAFLQRLQDWQKLRPDDISLIIARALLLRPDRKAFQSALLELRSHLNRALPDGPVQSQVHIVQQQVRTTLWVLARECLLIGYQQDYLLLAEEALQAAERLSQHQLRIELLIERIKLEALLLGSEASLLQIINLIQTILETDTESQSDTKQMQQNIIFHQLTLLRRMQRQPELPLNLAESLQNLEDTPLLSHYPIAYRRLPMEHLQLTRLLQPPAWTGPTLTAHYPWLRDFVFPKSRPKEICLLSVYHPAVARANQFQQPINWNEDRPLPDLGWWLVQAAQAAGQETEVLELLERRQGLQSKNELYACILRAYFAIYRRQEEVLTAELNAIQRLLPRLESRFDFYLAYVPALRALEMGIVPAIARQVLETCAVQLRPVYNKQTYSDLTSIYLSYRLIADRLSSADATTLRAALENWQQFESQQSLINGSKQKFAGLPLAFLERLAELNQSQRTLEILAILSEVFPDQTLTFDAHDAALGRWLDQWERMPAEQRFWELLEWTAKGKETSPLNRLKVRFACANPLAAMESVPCATLFPEWPNLDHTQSNQMEEVTRDTVVKARPSQAQSGWHGQTVIWDSFSELLELSERVGQREVLRERVQSWTGDKVRPHAKELLALIDLASQPWEKVATQVTAPLAELPKTIVQAEKQQIASQMSQNHNRSSFHQERLPTYLSIAAQKAEPTQALLLEKLLTHTDPEARAYGQRHYYYSRRADFGREDARLQNAYKQSKLLDNNLAPETTFHATMPTIWQKVVLAPIQKELEQPPSEWLFADGHFRPWQMAQTTGSEHLLCSIPLTGQFQVSAQVAYNNRLERGQIGLAYQGARWLTSNNWRLVFTTALPGRYVYDFACLSNFGQYSLPPAHLQGKISPRTIVWVNSEFPDQDASRINPFLVAQQPSSAFEPTPFTEAECGLIPSTAPWLSIVAHGTAPFPVLQQLKITGQPFIPQVVSLIQENDMTGWYEENMHFPTQFEWTQSRRAALPKGQHAGQLLQEWTRATNTNQRRLDQATVQGLIWQGVLQTYLETPLYSDTPQPRVLRYCRPLLPEETFSYEFYYEPGQWDVHAALGPIGYLFTPNTLALLWLGDQNAGTQSQERWQATPVSLPERMGQPLPLQPNRWNRAELRRHGDSITILLNQEPVYRHQLTDLGMASTEQQRTMGRPAPRFGLLYFPLCRRARVRAMTLTGNWPTDLSADALTALLQQSATVPTSPTSEVLMDLLWHDVPLLPGTRNQDQVQE